MITGIVCLLVVFLLGGGMSYSTADEVVKTAIRSVDKMAKDYSSWTADWIEPWKAPEYLYTVAITQALSRKFSGQVYCEYNTRSCIRESQAALKQGPFRKIQTAGSRPDILLTDGRTVGKFRFCIEVKRSVYSVCNIIKDLERCSRIISDTDNGTIDDAAVVFLAHRPFARHSEPARHSKKVLNERINKTFIGEGKNFGKSFKALSRLKDQGFKFKPFIGPISANSYEDELGENKTIHWTVGAVKISKD